MKRNLLLSLAFAILMLLTVSCEKVEPEPPKNIVRELGLKSASDSMASYIANLDNLEAVTELSSHVIKCEIISCDNISTTEMSALNFDYSVKVLDIIMDTRNTIKVGDIIPVNSSEGIIKVSEFVELIKNDPLKLKYYRIPETYTDNDYVVSSNFNAVPIEVGKTYIMYISDHYLENYGVYSESGRAYLYEYNDDEIHSQRSMTLSEESTDDIIAMIKAQAELRTGRADEVGEDIYMEELGQKQAEEHRKAAKAAE